MSLSWVLVQCRHSPSIHPLSKTGTTPTGIVLQMQFDLASDTMTPLNLFGPSVARAQHTMPAADFCLTVRSDLSELSASPHIRQTSRGKTLYFPRVDAQFIKRIPTVNGRLRGHVPTRLEYVTPHIAFLSIAPRFCLELPSDPTSR